MPAVGSASEALLAGNTVDGAVDYKGRPVARSTSGGWRSASFIIGVEIAEGFAFYGVSSNLISYLTGPLHQSTAAAAASINTLSGTAFLLPLLGAFIADSYLGRYKTVLFSSILYVLGLGLLTLSATIRFLRPPDCDVTKSLSTHSCPSPTRFQVFFFFMSLYVVSLAQGGHKPCVQAFGADQFDPRDPEESKSKSSFFNWWYFGLCGSTVFALTIINYIQDDLSWGLGFGIPCISLMVALLIFLLGTKTYRYYAKEEKSPFVCMFEVIVAAAQNRQCSPPATDKIGTRTIEHELMGCSTSQVEDAKILLRLVPIWATSLIYAVVVAQSYTFFTKQGSTMERGIGSGFQIPPAMLQSFISISILATIPIYDRLFVPLARAFTGLPSGITMLQRIGIGMFLSVISMVVAALVEAQRLIVAREAGLMDKPSETVPMSVWWLIPQYVLFGVVDVFTIVGLQEFFYDQVPNSMRSVGLSLEHFWRWELR